MIYEIKKTIWIDWHNVINTYKSQITELVFVFITWPYLYIWHVYHATSYCFSTCVVLKWVTQRMRHVKQYLLTLSEYRWRYYWKYCCSVVFFMFCILLAFLFFVMKLQFCIRLMFWISLLYFFILFRSVTCDRSYLYNFDL